MLQLWTLLTKEERNIVRKKREGPTDLVKHAYFKNKQCTVHQNKSLNPLFEKKSLSCHCTFGETDTCGSGTVCKISFVLIGLLCKRLLTKQLLPLEVHLALKHQLVKI